MTPLFPTAGHHWGGCASLIKLRKRNRLWRLYTRFRIYESEARPAALIPATPVETKRPRIKFCINLLYNKDQEISRNLTYGRYTYHNLRYNM